MVALTWPKLHSALKCGYWVFHPLHASLQAKVGFSRGPLHRIPRKQGPSKEHATQKVTTGPTKWALRRTPDPGEHGSGRPGPLPEGSL